MPVIRIDEETKAALEQHRLRLASDAQSGVGNSMNSTLRHLLEKKVAPLDETDQPTVRRQDDGGISISYPSELTSAEYESPVLGLVFLRFLDHKFASVQAQLEGQKSASSRRTIGKADYIAQGAIFLTEESRYAHLLQLPEGSDLGQAVSDAMETIENENPGLKGILPRDYSRVTNSILATLLRTFSEISIDIEGDVFGRIYEYFLGKFAMAAGQSGGESYTPTSLTKLIVEIIEPYSGRVLDPASGSAGMLVQSAEFVKRHERNLAELSIFGQENVAETVRLGKMNLAVNDLSGDIFHGNTYYEDVHDSVGKFDFVMANPPFNVTGIDKEQISDDPRFPFGMPGPDNGNYIWMQIFWSALNDGGRAGFVMANSASDVRQSEQEIRKQIIDAGDVDVMVAIGSNFFTHVTLPCTLWFFDKGKRETDRKDKVLFIDARNIFEQVDRAHREFRPDQIEFLANIVRLYRGQEIEDLMGSDDLMIENFPELTYQDVAGLCKVATVDEIRTQGYSLNPGRYVGVADKSSITGTAVGRPNSSDEVIQNLLDGLFSGALDRGIDLQLSRDRSGRWITYPDNFMSIMLQPRNRCLLITVYGKPEAFNELGHSLQLKIDRPPYSRFHVRTESQLDSALDIIESSRNLRADMIFGAALKFEPMQQFDVKPLEQTCSLLAVPTGLGKTSLIGQQIRSLSAERCLIITSSKAIAETMQAQLYARFALPFEVLDRTRTIEGTNVLPKRSGQFLFITTHHVFKQWLSTGECERLLPTREGPLWDLVAIEEIQPLVSSESLDFDEFTYGESWWERETTLRSPTFTNHLVVLTTPQVLQRTEELDSISNLFDQRWSYSGGSRLMSESTAQEVWRAVLGDLQLQFPRPTFETWLKPTEGVAYDDHVFEVEAPNSFAVEWLERRMYHALQKTLHEVSGREFELRLTVKPQGDFYAVEQSFPVPDQAVSATPAAPPLLEMRSFNPKYSFDTFVAGPSNRLALSASRDVAESPGQTYNPLFLHSGAGLGKTHLLQAIGKSCASRGMSVLYVTSEQFTNEFITAIRNRTTEDFRRRYRSVQVLLMDDVQFLSGNEQTHEGFFHTFNDLQNSGNQVVISSDRPPRELGSIEDRLRSRFEGGLIADIQPPDLETRMAILANKAGQMRIDLEDSVIELIAKRVQRNVRELEGSLNRMVAYSQLMNVNINLESTSRILDELTADTDRHSVDPERIIEEPLENRE